MTLTTEKHNQTANSDKMFTLPVIIKVVESIKNILEEDKKQKNPLFLSVKESVIFNLARRAVSEPDTRFLIGDPERYPQIAWQVSKVQPSLNGSITRFTMTQEQFNAATDNAELMIANYYENKVEPELPELEEIPTISNLEITYSGKPSVRAGGGYKKFTLKTRVDGELTDTTEAIEWNIDFPDGDLQKLTTSEVNNSFKIKCTNDYSLIGKTFTITAKSANNSTSLVVEVISL